ncbi:YadA-like family protein [Mitsuokella jalaludinii]|uniref:YadA-like family protein n=1 Tax=Mitsuokella jalaludinii TaxID=187979 RepID=UPI00307723FE
MHLDCKSISQNAGAVSIGALNSIESATTGNNNSGIANSIVGLANKTNNANGALIYGAGNEITNSSESISAPTSNISAKSAAESLRQSIKNNPGGAVLAIGGGNKADWTQRTQIIGVGNDVSGTSNQISEYNLIDGYHNTVKHAKHVTLIGSENKIEGTEKDSVERVILLGDNRNVGALADYSVVIGSSDNSAHSDVTRPDEVIIGHNAYATVEGGVAIGAGSAAETSQDVHGYDPLTKMASTSDGKEWKSSWAAVSIGDADHTRQITNLAAGFNDTDAVNVAQLKSVMNMPVHIYNGGKMTSGSYVTGTQIASNMTISNLQFDFGDGLKAQEVGNDGDKRVLVTLDKNTLKDDPAFKGPKGDKGDTGAPGPAGKDGGVGTVKGDGLNITVTNTETDPTKPANYQVSLNKDIHVNNATAKNITTDHLTVNEDASIEKGSKAAVNAGTVYNETRVKKDGTYVKSSNTAGENLSALDNQVASNASNITNINGRVNNLDSKINKVGAGAAALAALHPLDFDPDDKWDFAVGYGNYRDANSAAIGAFYRPDEDTMFSLGTNFGNGENMINAGVSFKFGPKGKSQIRPGSTQEITELRATVARQDDQLKKQDSEIKELKAMVQQLLAAQDKKTATK